jgi:hypothetical protein
MRWLFILLLLSGVTYAQNAHVNILRVGMVVAPCQNCPPTYPTGTLGYELTTNISTLATNLTRTWSYDPNISELGSDQSVWTWPVNLSCVGYSSDLYQCVLLTPNELLTCAHMGGEFGQTVTFHDTNGTAWVGVVTNVVGIIGDMVVARLSNSAPATIVIPWVLPPNYTNYFSSHSILGIPAFWCHKNAGQLEYAPIVECVDKTGIFGGFGTWLRIEHNGYGSFGSGTAGTGGDSASPAFLMYKNEPVLLFADSTGDDAEGMFVSG